MLAHIHDRRHDHDSDCTPLRLQGLLSSSAVAPVHALDEYGCLIDQLIHVACATLGAQHLDLRVYEAK